MRNCPGMPPARWTWREWLWYAIALWLWWGLWGWLGLEVLPRLL